MHHRNTRTTRDDLGGLLLVYDRGVVNCSQDDAVLDNPTWHVAHGHALNISRSRTGEF
jgi:hypothetical protein